MGKQGSETWGYRGTVISLGKISLSTFTKQLIHVGELRFIHSNITVVMQYISNIVQWETHI